MIRKQDCISCPLSSKDECDHSGYSIKDGKRVLCPPAARSSVTAYLEPLGLTSTIIDQVFDHSMSVVNRKLTKDKRTIITTSIDVDRGLAYMVPHILNFYPTGRIFVAPSIKLADIFLQKDSIEYLSRLREYNLLILKHKYIDMPNARLLDILQMVWDDMIHSNRFVLIITPKPYLEELLKIIKPNEVFHVVGGNLTHPVETGKTQGIL